jgi:hypothetical protein
MNKLFNVRHLCIHDTGEQIKLYNFAQAPVQPPKKPKGKVKISTIVPVAILIASVIGALYFSGTFNGLFVLGPARDLVGTWVTPLSTKFYIAIDGENVGSENRIMTWTITATNQENVVDVKVEFSYSNRQLVSGSGFVPDTSPMELTGIINGTQLTLTKADAGPIHQIGSVGVFTFTTSQMEGTWHDDWEGVYEQNVYTSTNGLKLLKQ